MTEAVSVIIPTLNAEKTLDALLGAIARQTVKPAEVLVVDSDSTDRTLEICRGYRRVIGAGRSLRILHVFMSGHRQGAVFGAESTMGRHQEEYRRGHQPDAGESCEHLYCGNRSAVHRRQVGIATFGKVSLALSVSNLLMVFIRAVAVVLFPMLKRANEDKIIRAYGLIRSGLMIPVLGMLVLYYPLKVVLAQWLPQYAESLRYMAPLFPICVFESKMSMLIETYMKALRMERKLLMVNAVSVALGAALSVVCVTVLNDLTLAVFSILVLVAFRCVFSESLLTAKLGLSIRKDIVLEVAVAGSFVVFSWFVGGITGAAMYFAVYAAYIFMKRDEVKAVIAHLRAPGKADAKGVT